MQNVIKPKVSLVYKNVIPDPVAWAPGDHDWAKAHSCFLRVLDQLRAHIFRVIGRDP